MRAVIRSRLTVRQLAAILLMAAVAGLSLFSASRWVDRNAREEAGAEAAQAATIHAGLLASELQKFRLLPLILSEYPGVGDILSEPDADPGRLNEQLALFAERTGAAVIYVIRTDGRTLAASNWAQPTSFVGQDYGFRPYFRQALSVGEAEMFGLGTVSGRPGLFIARRIDGAAGPLGAIVVKVEFDAIEAQWAQQAGPSFVTDQRGIVIVTSRPEWRFRATRPLAPQVRDAIRRSIQFGDLPLDALPLATTNGIARVEGSRAGYRMASHPVPLTGARLWYLQPIEPARARAMATARLAMLSFAVLAALAFAWSWRAQVRRRALEEARETLEIAVADRTSALREANARLTSESDRRQAADRRFRAAREELAHANRIGSIGQITAGVTHEINQPVAAIQTFAENARKLIGRADYERAGGNLDQIVTLTERIGKITGELRGYARRGTPTIGSVALSSVIDGALLLVGDRIASANVRLERRGSADGIAVIADRIRLEQVLINLIQNALDATGGRPEARIEIAIRRDEDIVVTVADNGPGIAPEIADEIFTPFVTGRRDGLGLGLGIARDIMREFGGRLETVASPLGGAAFAMHLKREP